LDDILDPASDTYASIIDTSFRASLLQLQNYDPILDIRFAKNNVANWIFKGKDATLISKELQGTVNLSDNKFKNIGQLNL